MSHLHTAWRKLAASLSSMGPYPDYPDGFVFSPPLYQSGFTLGQTVTINHPEMGGVEVQGEVVGEIAQSGIVMVQLPGVDGVVQVPLEMINESSA